MKLTEYVVLSFASRPWARIVGAPFAGFFPVPLSEPHSVKQIADETYFRLYAFLVLVDCVSSLGHFNGVYVGTKKDSVLDYL